MITSILSFRRWLTIPLVLAALLLVVACWFGGRELIANKTLTAKLQELKQQGVAIDDESLARRFKEQTHPEGAKAWSDVFSLLQARQNMYGSGLSQIATKPWSQGEFEWKDRELGTSFLNDMRPLITEIEKACQAPKPVWQPIHFQGVSTLLEPVQHARAVVDFLGLEAQHAIEERDASRAMRALVLMQKTVESFDWNCFLVSKLANVAAEESVRTVIRRSLCTEFWDNAQLDSLATLVGPAQEIENTWKMLVDSELAVGLDYLRQGGDEGFGPQATKSYFALPTKLPTNQLRFVNMLRPWREVAQGGLFGLQGRVSAMTSKQVQNHSYDTFAPLVTSWESLARVLVNQEELRRLTLTAIALRRYHNSKNAWPSELQELEEFGLGQQLSQTVDTKRFGYRAEADAVYLWNTRAGAVSQNYSTSNWPIETFDELQQRKQDQRSSFALGSWVLLSAGSDE